MSRPIHVEARLSPRISADYLQSLIGPDATMSAALSAIHDRVNTPWTFESLAEAAGMSRSAFAARFKELLGQTPLEHVTEWDAEGDAATPAA